MTEAVNVKIGEYIPGLKLSMLQWVSIYHDRPCQRYTSLVHTMTKTVNATIGRYIS